MLKAFLFHLLAGSLIFRYIIPARTASSHRTVASQDSLQGNIRKVTGNKAELIKQLVTHWECKCTGSDRLLRSCGGRSGTATALRVAD